MSGFPVPGGMATAGSPPLPTVVVGGLGGSGTRIVASLLRSGGLRIGDDLNDALDNLWATLLFKHPGLPFANDAEIDLRLALFAKAMLGLGEPTPQELAGLERLARDDRPQHPAQWLHARMTALVAACRRPQDAGAWGWKEPNSHMLLPHIARWGVRYIHVVRGGLYMSGSRNRNQHAYWADALGCPDPRPTPAYALKFWCAVQRRAELYAEKIGSRFLMLDYDALCADPPAGIATLNRFMDGSGVGIDSAAARDVSPPKPHAGGLDPGLDRADVAYAMSRMR